MDLERRAARAGLPVAVPVEPAEAAFGLGADLGDGDGVIRVHEWLDAVPDGTATPQWWGGMRAALHTLAPAAEAVDAARHLWYGVNPPEAWERWRAAGTAQRLAWAAPLRRHRRLVDELTRRIDAAYRSIGDHVRTHRESGAAQRTGDPGPRRRPDRPGHGRPRRRPPGSGRRLLGRGPPHDRAAVAGQVVDQSLVAFAEEPGLEQVVPVALDGAFRAVGVPGDGGRLRVGDGAVGVGVVRVAEKDLLAGGVSDVERQGVRHRLYAHRAPPWAGRTAPRSFARISYERCEPVGSTGPPVGLAWENTWWCGGRGIRTHGDGDTASAVSRAIHPPR